MWRCRDCRVDCSISMYESQERRLELRIETWQNMGSVHRFSCQCTQEPLRFQPSSPLCRECDDSKNTMRHWKSQAATQSTPRHYLTLIRMEDLVDGDLSRLLPASFDESGNFLTSARKNRSRLTQDQEKRTRKDTKCLPHSHPPMYQ